MSDTQKQTIFKTAHELTGVMIPPEQQTDAVRQVLERLSEVILLDNKTGVPNSRAMDMDLERHLAIAKSYAVAGNMRQEPPRPSTFVMIDLDGFKAINDTYGHDAGDAALKYFATFMRKNLRPADKVGRVGGDEFAAIMEASDGKATSVMIRLREQLEREPFEWQGSKPYLSFSFGVHEITSEDKDIEAIKKDADAGAYKDKKDKPTRRVVGDATERLKTLQREAAQLHGRTP